MLPEIPRSFHAPRTAHDNVVGNIARATNVAAVNSAIEGVKADIEAMKTDAKTQSEGLKTGADGIAIILCM